MRLFVMKNHELTVREEVWGLAPFAKLLARDKTKDKVRAHNEMLFIWHYCDIRSDYQHLTDDKERAAEIKKDLKLPASWKLDATMEAAIDCYKRGSSTVVQTLYKQTLMSASAIGKYLANTEALLAERDMHGKVVTDIAKITSSVQKVPKLMADLKAAYKEVIKEQEEMDNRKKGSRTMNTFEDGFNMDEI